VSARRSHDSDRELVYRRTVSENGRVTYEPVGKVWDVEVWPLGTHVVVVAAGCRTTSYQIDPDKAAVVSVLGQHRAVVQEAMKRAIKGRPYPDTERAQVAFAAWRKAGGVDGDAWVHGTANDVLNAILDALEAP